MSEEMREEMFNERREWLASLGADGGDIFEDEYGEFIYTSLENGTSGEDNYAVDRVRVRLPKHLELKNIQWKTKTQ